jgi:hypothetical protein
MTFNANSFYLPVLRYRALVNRVAAPGLSMRRFLFGVGRARLFVWKYSCSVQVSFSWRKAFFRFYR